MSHYSIWMVCAGVVFFYRLAVYESFDYPWLWGLASLVSSCLAIYLKWGNCGIMCLQVLLLVAAAGLLVWQHRSFFRI